MPFNFRSFALTAAILCFGLSLVWLAAPQCLLNLWGVPVDEAVKLVGRRSGALFLGVGAMFFTARGAGPSVARQALLVGFGIGCAALAALGLVELAAGRVGAGILLAVVTEVLFAGAALALLATKPERDAATCLDAPQADIG
jgi:hypothetical protein